jgi:hypothetical protein
MIVEIFSGLASMLRSKTIKPSSIPFGIPKTHFLGLNLMFVAYRHLKA